MAPHIPRMVANIAADLGIDADAREREGDDDREARLHRARRGHRRAGGLPGRVDVRAAGPARLSSRDAARRVEHRCDGSRQRDATARAGSSRHASRCPRCARRLSARDAARAIRGARARCQGNARGDGRWRCSEVARHATRRRDARASTRLRQARCSRAPAPRGPAPTRPRALRSEGWSDVETARLRGASRDSARRCVDAAGQDAPVGARGASRLAAHADHRAPGRAARRPIRSRRSRTGGCSRRTSTPASSAGRPSARRGVLTSAMLGPRPASSASTTTSAHALRRRDPGRTSPTRRCARRFRSADLLYRFGGEEFVVIFGVDPRRARAARRRSSASASAARGATRSRAWASVDA